MKMNLAFRALYSNFKIRAKFKDLINLESEINPFQINGDLP